MGSIEESPLSKGSIIVEGYDPNLLYPIKRDIHSEFIQGYDLWSCYEVSWIETIPTIGVIQFKVPLSSPNIVESKSLKLYLNSLNFHEFTSTHEALDTIKGDLEKALEASIDLAYTPFDQFQENIKIKGQCIDRNIENPFSDTPSPQQLNVKEKKVSNYTVHTHLFRSNCPVTQQPDWASIEIAYSGHEIEEASLLRYLLSYRNHNAFHETCIEQIFNDIYSEATPSQLTIKGHFQRRGGIAIQPVRYK